MYAIIGNFGPWEIGFILLIILIIIGPGKLPQVAELMGNTIKRVRKAADDHDESD